jgi:methionine aminopeptidase
MMAAYNAAEAAIRLIKPGKSNWDVTDAIQKITDDYECKPVEGKSI